MKKFLAALSLSLCILTPAASVSALTVAHPDNTPIECSYGTHGEWCFAIEQTGTYIDYFAMSFVNHSNITYYVIDTVFQYPQGSPSWAFKVFAVAPGHTLSNILIIQAYEPPGTYCLNTGDETAPGALCDGIGPIT